MLDYEIRDVNNRRAGPLVILKAYLARQDSGGVFERIDEGYGSVIPADQQPVGSGRGQPAFPAALILKSKNLGRGTATAARFDLGLPSKWTLNPSPPSVEAEEWQSNNGLLELVGSYVTIFINSTVPRVVPRVLRSKGFCEQKIGWLTGVHHGETSRKHPLWPSPELEVDIATINVALPNITEDVFWIPWKVVAEGMPESRGAVLVKKDTSEIYMRNFDIGEVDWAGESEDKRFETLKQSFLGIK